MLLGLTPGQAQLFIEDWKRNYGYVCAKFVPTLKNDVVKVARYCSKYICKLKEFDMMPNPHAEKPRKLTSIGYGMPNSTRFQRMKDYYLAKDFIKYDENDLHLKAADIDRLVDEIIKRRKYNLDGNLYKLPMYYRKKIFYTLERDTRKMRASEIQHLISWTVQRRTYQDFIDSVKELEAMHNLRTFAEAAYMYNHIQFVDRKAREKAIKENNLRYLKKAKVA